MKQISFHLPFLLAFLLLLSCAPANKVTLPAASASSARSDALQGHENDAVNFSKLYPVSADNPFIIASYEEIETHLKFGTGVIVFAFPACPYCRHAFPVLESVFRETGMEKHTGFSGKILYYDIFNDREENNERYNTLVSYLKDFLPNDSSGNPRIYSPQVVFLKSGKIVGGHIGTVSSQANPQDPLDDGQMAELRNIYMELIREIEDL